MPMRADLFRYGYKRKPGEYLSNGVSTYPVTVTMDEAGDLLPGMNVDGIITLDPAEDVLSIPVDALMREIRST